MKILAIADIEDPLLWDYWRRERTRDIDLILSCGDLKAAYLEFLTTMVNVPLLYVRGNHDDCYQDRPPEGCDCIDGKLVVHNGIRIMGLGGSIRYKPGDNQYTETGMFIRAMKLSFAIARAGGIDILVTHAPAKGYGDLEDYPHWGFETFNSIMTHYQPKYMLHGHVHTNYGIVKKEYLHPSGTKIFNVCGYKILDI
jgi:Icc-related predicted phosphoesterase